MILQIATDQYNFSHLSLVPLGKPPLGKPRPATEQQQQTIFLSCHSVLWQQNSHKHSSYSLKKQ